MQHDFWHRRWQKNEIGFHESEGNHLLTCYFDALKLPENPRVFVPLCGKTRDIAWLLNLGAEVVAIELNELAVIALFDELGLSPNKVVRGNLIEYSGPNVVVYVGDFFTLNSVDIGSVDAIYDRAALVALPQTLRDQYTQHLRHITHAQKQLIITFEYDQTLFDGPPFSVSEAEIKHQYNQHYTITQLYRDKIPDGFRSVDEVYEGVYLLA
jgi:thiopurine S-methyltransferase